MSKNLQPKIRFRGFSDDWNFNNLDDLVWYKNGISLEAYIDKNAKYYLVTLNSIDIDGDLKANHLKVCYISNYVLEKNDIVMILSDVAHGDFLGLSALIPSDDKYILNQRIASLKIKDKHKISHNFLRFFINANQSYFKKLGQGSSQLNLSKKSVLGLTAYFPEKIEEQKQIGDFFQSIDKDIALQEEKLNKTKNLKKAMLEKMLPKEGSKQPEVRFDGFSGDWSILFLSAISENIEYGLNAAAKEFDGENKYIRITDIDDESHRFVQKKLTSPDVVFENINRYILQDRDILFARTGASVGKTYIFDKNDGVVYFAGFLIKARIMQEFDAYFVFINTLTERYKHFVTITSQRSGQPGINAMEYGSFSFYVPHTKQEQEKIGGYFKELDKAIAAQSEQLEKLKNIKKAYLAKMFV